MKTMRGVPKFVVCVEERTNDGKVSWPIFAKSLAEAKQVMKARDKVGRVFTLLKLNPEVVIGGQRKEA